MDKATMKYLFESDNITGYLTLQKTDMSDEEFVKLLAIKPSDINTILARVVAIIKENDPQKSKKDLVNDVLEILERSPSARMFVGIGVQQEYKLLKGFPVRKGDPYESMPEAGTELVLKPSELYIGWTTDGTVAREDAVHYDVAKGEPIGGLLVDVHVDITKLLFDVNAVIRVVKSKIKAIDAYNQQAAPGKSISKTNSSFLATEAALYAGRWEVVSTNKVVNVRVVDKWVWDTTSGTKKIKWSADAQTTQVKEPVQDTEKTQPEIIQPEKNPQEQPQQVSSEVPQQATVPDKNLQEKMRRLFESEGHKFNDSILPVYEELMDEEAWQGVKNFFAKTFGTMRGKKMTFLQSLINFYTIEKEVYQIAAQFAQSIDKDDKRYAYAQEKIDNADTKIEDIKQILQDVKSGLNIDDIPSVDTSTDPNAQAYDSKDQTPEEKAVDAQHAQMKKQQTADVSNQGSSEEDLPPLPATNKGK